MLSRNAFLWPMALSVETLETLFAFFLKFKYFESLKISPFQYGKELLPNIEGAVVNKITVFGRFHKPFKNSAKIGGKKGRHDSHWIH